jgi:urease accessory protein
VSLLPIIAHGSIEGIGDLWNGVLHPLRSPAHLLVIAGLGIYAGQRLRFKNEVLAFILCTALGLVCTQSPLLPEIPAGIPCVFAALAGAMVALRRPFPKALSLMLFCGAGFAVGWDSGAEVSPGWVSLKILAGTWLGVSVLILNLANYAAMVPKKAWLKIGARVLGSWITAISALYLALLLKR